MLDSLAIKGLERPSSLLKSSILLPSLCERGEREIRERDGFHFAKH